MTRPSRRLTLMASSENWTSSTRSSVLLCADDAEKLIPCLQKLVTRIGHYRLYRAQFVGAKSKVARKLDRTKPGAPILTLFEKWPTRRIWRSRNENIVGANRGCFGVSAGGVKARLCSAWRRP